MSDLTPEMRAEMERILDAVKPGMLLAAMKLRQFYQFLSSMELLHDVIMAEITAWCQGESRLAVDPIIHQLYMQQHQPQPEPPDKKTE